MNPSSILHEKLSSTEVPTSVYLVLQVVKEIYQKKEKKLTIIFWKWQIC